MCGFVSVDSKRGHVSISWFGHNVQFGFGCVVGQNIFFFYMFPCIGRI